MFKPFFVHRHTNLKFPKRVSHPRGFTLYVQPDPNDYKMCVVSGTWCAHDDNFCRKIGRDNAIKAEQRTLNKRDLPAFLNRMEEECQLDFVREDYSGIGSDFTYIYKYLF